MKFSLNCRYKDAKCFHFRKVRTGENSDRIRIRGSSAFRGRLTTNPGSETLAGSDFQRKYILYKPCVTLGSTSTA